MLTTQKRFVLINALNTFPLYDALNTLLNKIALPNGSLSMALEAKTTYEHLIKQSGPSINRLKNVSLFANLTAAESDRFYAAAQSRSYKKGYILYLEDELAEFFYVICKGWIKLFHTMPEGDEVIVDMLTIGHTAGESAVFEHSRHTSSAYIIEDVSLLSIPSRLLKEQIHQSPTLALNMLSAMSQHHRRHYDQMALNAMQSAPQRVGCFLLRLRPKDEKQGVIVHLPYDKTLIAHTLGMSGSTFSRALNVLRKKTGIRINGTYVEIESPEALIKFVYGSLVSSNTLEVSQLTVRYP